MNIYETAAQQVINELLQIKEEISKLHEYDAINNITARIKTPQSIIKKMKKKNYELTYKNLIEKVNDIAGIRVVCPIKKINASQSASSPPCTESTKKR